MPFDVVMSTGSTMEKVSASNKKLRAFPHVFRNPLFFYTTECYSNTCTFPPDVLESVGICFYRIRSKKKSGSKANVNQGREMMDKMLRKRELPCVQR